MTIQQEQRQDTRKHGPYCNAIPVNAQSSSRRGAAKAFTQIPSNSSRKKRNFDQVEDATIKEGSLFREYAVPSSKKRSKVVAGDDKKGFGTSFGAVKKTDDVLNRPARGDPLREMASSPLYGMKQCLEIDLPCVATDKKRKQDVKKVKAIEEARKLLDFNFVRKEQEKDEGFVSKATSIANSVSPDENQLIPWATSQLACPKPVAPVPKPMKSVAVKVPSRQYKYQPLKDKSTVQHTIHGQQSDFVAYDQNHRTVTPNGTVQLCNENSEIKRLQNTTDPNDLFKYIDVIPDADEPQTSRTKQVAKLQVSKYIPQDSRDVIMSPSGTLRHRPRAAKSPWPENLPKMSQVLFEEFTFRDELFMQWHQVEETYQPDPNYFGHQKLCGGAREVIIDELMHAAMSLKLHRQTLQLAINFFDRFMSYTTSLNPMLFQVLACCALSLAVKSEEESKTFDLLQILGRFPEVIFSKQQVCAIELKMAQILEWRLSPPTVFDWSCLYMRKATLCYPIQFPAPAQQESNCQSDDKYANMTFQFRTDIFQEMLRTVDVFFSFQQSLQHVPSEIAATAFHIACSNHLQEFKSQDSRFDFKTIFETCTNFEEDEILACQQNFTETVLNKSLPNVICNRHLVNCDFREIYQDYPVPESKE